MLWVSVDNNGMGGGLTMVGSDGFSLELGKIFTKMRCKSRLVEVIEKFVKKMNRQSPCQKFMFFDRSKHVQIPYIHRKISRVA